MNEGPGGHVLHELNQLPPWQCFLPACAAERTSDCTCCKRMHRSQRPQAPPASWRHMSAPSTTAGQTHARQLTCRKRTRLRSMSSGTTAERSTVMSASSTAVYRIHPRSFIVCRARAVICGKAAARVTCRSGRAAGAATSATASGVQGPKHHGRLPASNNYQAVDRSSGGEPSRWLRSQSVGRSRCP